MPLEPMVSEDSSPAVADGVVCFGGVLQWPFYALDSKSGALLWKHNTRVCGSAALVEDMVYFCSLDQHLYAADLKTGVIKWKFKADADIEASPILAGGVVYVVDNHGTLYAIEGPAKEEVGPAGREEPTFGPVIKRVPPAGVRGNPQCTGVFKTRGVHSFGGVRWKFKAKGQLVSTPVVYDGVAYFGCKDLIVSVVPEPPRWGAMRSELPR